MGNQSVQDSLFVAPPVDFSLNLAEIYKWNAEKNAHFPMLRWYTHEKEIQERTWGESVEKFYRVAGNILATLGKENSGKGQVVGILATTGQIDYWTLVSGVMLAGYVPFAISPRNSTQAVEYLLEATKAKHLVISEDKSKVVEEACSKFSIRCFNVEDFLLGKPEDLELPMLGMKPHDPALIIHSSGSSAFPRPVVFSHKVVQQWLEAPRLSNYDLTGKVLALHSLPMYHGFGLLMTMATFSGAIAAFPAPDEPSHIPTAESVLTQGCNVKGNFLFAVPSIIETWAESSESIQKLKRFDVVSYGGGPLATNLGNSLVRNGVPIVNHYGLTELGTISKFWWEPRSLEDGEWVYWEILPCLALDLVPVEGMEDHFRLIVKQTGNHVLTEPNMVLDDGSLAYDTNDIIARHPRDPQLWKIAGRYDDQIMHSTGEKTNPGPIEAILRQSPYVQDALMFGRSRFHAGVIISPTEKASSIFLPELIDAIWPEVEQANEFAPSHSRILREMIIVEHPAKPFEYTAKRSLRRRPMTALYEDEINAAYEALESVSKGTSEKTLSVEKAESFEDTLFFVRETVKPYIPNEIGDDDDIFLAGGGDSLSASRIRSSIVKALVYGSALPSGFVYTLPSISKIAAFVHGVNVISQVVATQDPDSLTPQEDDEATVVRFHEAPEGQVPLIMLHGGGGNIYDLSVMQVHFTTGFWAIQVTSETPLTSLEAQTDFYFQKIKEQQPQGPYRIGAYSGSTILACRLAMLFEASGDKVLQLAFVDHFATIFVRPDLPLNDRQAYAEKNVISLADMFRRDTVPRRQKLADELLDAFYGKPSTELAQMLAQMYPVSVRIILDFIESLRQGGDEEMIDAVTRWMKTVKAPVTLYVASEGIQLELPESEEWKDLGVRRVYPHARVIHVEGNHFGVAENKDMIADLEGAYALKN